MSRSNQLALISLLILFTQAVLAQQQEIPYKQVPPKEGERCLICGTPLSEEDVTLMVRGRRVPLTRGMVDSFMDKPNEYFARLEPRSALFQENMNAPEGTAQGGISLGWFLFGAYVLVALFFGGLSGYVAVNKGLAAIPNFFVGLAFSVFGFLYVLTRPPAKNKRAIPAGLARVPDTSEPVNCPNCGAENHPSAKSCNSCGKELKPAYESEVSRLQKTGQ